MENKHKPSTRFCNCCAKNVPVLVDAELGESICQVCRSYDLAPRVRSTDKYSIHAGQS